MKPTSLQQTPVHAQRTKCEIYTRVMGYYRPVSHFNIGKKSEFYSRNYFIQPKQSQAINHQVQTAYNQQK